MRNSTKFALFTVNNIIWVILIIGILLASIFINSFFSFNNFINIIYHSTVLGFLVLAVSICLISGNIDLSVESTLAFAPAMAVLMMNRGFFGTNPYLTILITVAIGALIGLINAFFVTKVKINSFLMTLVMLIILRGLCLFFVRISIFNINPVYLYLGSAFLGKIPVAILFLVITYLFMHFFLTVRPIGRNIYAVGGNKKAAFISGIKVNVVITIAFVLSGIFASIAGLITAGRLNSIVSSMGEGLVFMAIAAAVLGGASLNGGEGKVSGIFAGVLLLGVIDNSLNLLGIHPNIIYSVKGAILLVAIIIDQMKINISSLILKRENFYQYSTYKKN